MLQINSFRILQPISHFKILKSTLWKFQMGFNLFSKPHTRTTGSSSQPGEISPNRSHLEMYGGGLSYDNN